MARWEPQAAERLRTAALELFLEHGYDNVTVAQITERAGLTRRTFSRYFADKRDVLFAGSERLPPALAGALLRADRSLPPFAALVLAITEVGEQLPGQAELAAQRRTIVQQSTELRERAGTKFAEATDALAEALRQRGTPPASAALLAEVGTALFRSAFERWTDEPGRASFGEHVRAAAAELAGSISYDLTKAQQGAPTFITYHCAAWEGRGDMCGITGWVDFGRDLRGQRAAIAAMTATMICRGPDAGEAWVSAHAAIGHRRLSVIDLPGGGQPMHAPGADDVVLTFSGEIYNHAELRRELAARGHQFLTRSDTEVLLHCYLEWGADCVRRLNGMFALGVWDGRRQELLLARDRLGVKPLYYAPLAEGVLFGSEPKALFAHPQFRPEIDAEGLAELFSQFGTGTPGHGVYRGLAQVKPGTLVRVGRDGIHASAYWMLETREHTDDLATTAGTVRELLADAVGRQTVADVPLCSLLSGGLDSSVVSALAADSLRRRDQGKLATFSVDFAGSAAAFMPDQLRPSHDEPFARAAAEHIGSCHGTITLEAEDLVEAQWLPLAAHDLPVYGDVYVSFALLCREISKQATVALSGEGADEVFGGYPWFHVPALLAAPTFPWAARGSWEPLLQPDVRARVRLAEYAADRYAQALAEVPQLAGESPWERRIREVLYLGLTRWLPLLLDRKDRLSMAYGLEVRVPFTDHRLVEYVWNVPWSMKEANGIEKGLLRTAAHGLLPADLLRRRKSTYPGAADQAYQRAIDAQLRRLLTHPYAPVFDLISRERLADAYAADPRLPGLMSVQPSSTAPVAFLLDVNRWLEQSGVTIR